VSKLERAVSSARVYGLSDSQVHLESKKLLGQRKLGLSVTKSRTARLIEEERSMSEGAKRNPQKNGVVVPMLYPWLEQA